MFDTLLNIQTHTSLYLFTCMMDELATLNKALQASDILLANVANLVSNTVRRLRDGGDEGFAKPSELNPQGEHNPWAVVHRFLDYEIDFV